MYGQLMRGRRLSAVCVTVVALIFAVTGCDLDPFERDLSPRTVDAGQAQQALLDISVVLPARYRFVAGRSEPPPLSGHWAYFLRYDQDGTVDLPALAEMNYGREFGPEFGRVLQAKCGSELSTYSLVSAIGLRCDRSTPLVVIRNDGRAAGDFVELGYQAIVARAEEEAHQIYIVSPGT